MIMWFNKCSVCGGQIERYCITRITEARVTFTGSQVTMLSFNRSLCCCLDHEGVVEVLDSSGVGVGVSTLDCFPDLALLSRALVWKRLTGLPTIYQ